MRILIDHAAYSLKNIGDTVMIEALIQRCKAAFPDSQVTVVGQYESTKTRFPSVSVADVAGRNHLLGRGRLLGRLGPMLGNVDHAVTVRLPTISTRLSRWRLRNQEGVSVKLIEQLDSYIDAISQADVVMAAGGGYLTDSFAESLGSVVTTFRIAQALQKPTFMLGQGLGPLEDAALRRRLARVMSQLTFLTIREKRRSLPLAHALGVPPERIAVTGDAAVGVAYAQKPPRLGPYLGMNVRVSSYSGIDKEKLEVLKQATALSLQEQNAKAIAIPISSHPEENDAAMSEALIANNIAQGVASFIPDDAIRLAGLCRVVITGSYHAAVFALSQGVTAITLYATPYYEDKMRGLVDQFGVGCSALSLTSRSLMQDLQTEINRAWETAELNRPKLLARAEEQIEAGYAAFQRVARLIACN